MSKKGNKNARTHGSYAKEIVLPDESAEEFEQLHQEFRLQFNPDGGTEGAVVRQLAATQWQKDRLERRLSRAYELDEHIASEIGQSPLDTIVRLLKPSNQQPALFVLDQQAKVVRQLADLNLSYHNVGTILKLREQLDRSFDRGVQRLVTMKEFKRQYGAKLIEQLPQTEPTSLAPDVVR